MKRLTMLWYDGNQAICENEECSLRDCPFADPICEQVQSIIDRLAAYEDTGLEPENIISVVDMAKVACALEELNAYKELGSLDRLRELAEAERLIGENVYEPNKRGFISTYEIISVHISKCSILVGWNLIDGVYSNLNGFEISALGKCVFLTRADAEAALRREQDG